MSAHDDHLPEAVRIAAARWAGPQPITELSTTIILDDDDCEQPIPVTFERDIDDTWAITLGSNFLAVRNKARARIITRMVELLVAQRQAIVFGRDGTERPDR
jgi:hypothetical protein